MSREGFRQYMFRNRVDCSLELREFWWRQGWMRSVSRLMSGVAAAHIVRLFGVLTAGVIILTVPATTHAQNATVLNNEIDSKGLHRQRNYFSSEPWEHF